MLLNLDSKIIDLNTIKTVEPTNYGQGALIIFKDLKKKEIKNKIHTNHYHQTKMVVERRLFSVKKTPVNTLTHSHATEEGEVNYIYENLNSPHTYFKTCELLGIKIEDKYSMLNSWLKEIADKASKYFQDTKGGALCTPMANFLISTNYFYCGETFSIEYSPMQCDWVLILGRREYRLRTSHELFVWGDGHKRLAESLLEELLIREKEKPLIAKGFQLELPELFGEEKE